MRRREFLIANAGGIALAAADTGTPGPAAAIDFRYSPLSYQTAYCFPHDPHKSLAGNRGELRLGAAFPHGQAIRGRRRISITSPPS
jgi:hypothetical protein